MKKRSRSQEFSCGIKVKRTVATLAAIWISVIMTLPEAFSQRNPSTEVELPAPPAESAVSVEEALRKRRSERDYADKPLSLSDVSRLLWAAQGVTSSDGKRTAPSAGALYPLEVYLVVGEVDGLGGGVYRYDPRRHTLAMTVSGDRRGKLAKAALGQSFVAEAAVDVVIAGVYERATGKYGRRGVRYVHMEAGHASQNIYLQAVSLGFGTVAVGAFDDGDVKKILELPKDEEPLYIMPVGKVR